MEGALTDQASYFGLASEPLIGIFSAVSGLIGVVLGAAITVWLTNRSQKKNRALLFFREFNSREFSSIRDDAYGYIIRNPSSKMYGAGISAHEMPEIKPMWVIARFFQSLSLNIKFGNVDKVIATNHFGFLFVWWWHNYFKHAMRPGWQIRKDLEDFDRRLINLASAEYEEWMRTAIEDFHQHGLMKAQSKNSDRQDGMASGP